MKKLLLMVAAAMPLMFTGCSKDDSDDSISLVGVEKILYYQDQYQIEATSNSKITYSVENEYHATVSETGLVTAGRVGETKVFLSNGSDSKSFKIMIAPKSLLYPEPNAKTGDSRASIIGKFGMPSAQTSTDITYLNYSQNVAILMFSFDSYDKLRSYGVLL